MKTMQSISTAVISLDMGTSSIRACLVDESLNILFQRSISVRLDSGLDGRAEQDTEEIITAVLTCLRDVTNWAVDKNITPAGLCCSNAVASLVMLDEKDRPMAPALTWADTRAAREADTLKECLGVELYERTACPMHASYWLPKLQWLKHSGRLKSTSPRFCTLKDLLLLRITGQFVTDSSNAAATGMRNTISGAWDDLALREAGITELQLPRILGTTTVLGIKKSAFVSQSGLDEKTPVILGATDGVLSSLGAGAFEQGQVTSMVGSSGACRVAASQPDVSDPHQRLWSYPLTEKIWVRGGAMTNGGLVTQWFTENFYGKGADALAHMLSEAATVKPGAEGVIFLPYLFGERAPIYNEHARGVFFGLHGSHTRAHMARAALEGVFCALATIYEVLRDSIDKVKEVRATGGYVRSPLSLQIQADIFNFPISVPVNYEGSSIGAAALAFLALGKYIDFSPVKESLKIERAIEPIRNNQPIYKAQLVLFKEIYTRISPIFTQGKSR
jgi:gluconokinase